jgi:hypothetical protein
MFLTDPILSRKPESLRNAYWWTNSMVGSGHVDKGAIWSLAGDSKWAGSPHFDVCLTSWYILGTYGSSRQQETGSLEKYKDADSD